MNNNLKQYFPMIRTREEVLEEINSSVLLADTYNSWSENCQREFIDICTGAKGVKILYDSFFKELKVCEGTYIHMSKQKLNKIAARWPAKAVAQLFTFSKKRQ